VGYQLHEQSVTHGTFKTSGWTTAVISGGRKTEVILIKKLQLRGVSFTTLNHYYST